MNDRKKILISFLIGVVVGGLIFSLSFYCRHPMSCKTWIGRPHKGPKPKKILEKMSKELKLSVEQKSQAEKILDESFNKAKELRDKARPEFENIMNSAHSKIRAVLNPEQQAKFDKIIEKMEKHREKIDQRMERGK